MGSKDPEQAYEKGKRRVVQGMRKRSVWEDLLVMEPDWVQEVVKSMREAGVFEIFKENP